MTAGSTSLDCMTRRMARACAGPSALASRAAASASRCAKRAISRLAPAAMAAPLWAANRAATPARSAGAIGVPLRSGAMASHSRATSSMPLARARAGGMPRRGGAVAAAAAAPR